MPRDFFGRVVKTDIFGRKIPEKQIKREILEENRIRGKAAEDSYAMRARLAGYEVNRTGRGHDFRIRKRDLFTGRVTYSGLREVKSSRTAPISDLQKKTKKRKSNYKVVRQDPGIFF